MGARANISWLPPLGDRRHEVVIYALDDNRLIIGKDISKWLIEAREVARGDWSIAFISPVTQ
jgi:hypothetical protein